MAVGRGVEGKRDLSLRTSWRRGWLYPQSTPGAALQRGWRGSRIIPRLQHTEQPISRIRGREGQSPVGPGTGRRPQQEKVLSCTYCALPCPQRHLGRGWPGRPWARPGSPDVFVRWGLGTVGGGDAR